MEHVKMDHQQVMEVLPHRPPILLVDEVIDLIPGQEITAVLHVSPNMDIFRGHFPGNPVLPGVYSVESMAQSSVILMMTIEKYRGKTPLFLGIQSASFKRPIQPGDDLRLHAVLISERADKAILTCHCETYVGKDLAAQCEVAVAMR